MIWINTKEENVLYKKKNYFDILAIDGAVLVITYMGSASNAI